MVLAVPLHQISPRVLYMGITWVSVEVFSWLKSIFLRFYNLNIILLSEGIESLW